MLAAAAEPFEQHVNVYLLRVVWGPEGPVPKANIPIVPAASPVFPLLHPQLRADIAPNADGEGISGSLELSYGCEDSICRAACFDDIVGVCVNRTGVTRSRSRATLPDCRNAGRCAIHLH